VAARDATDQIGRAVAGSDFVVITAGLGGGTGSGAAPVIAEIARQKGALTMAVVTTPFGFEGTRRQQLAQSAAGTLAGKVDAVATIPNDRVREGLPANATVEDAFRAIDDALCRTVGEILDLVAVRGRMNLDFADVRTVLQGGGAAAVGIGRASGENRAVEAARTAMASALPGASKARPTSILVNVSGSNKLRLAEVDSVAETLLAAAGNDADLVFGMSLRPRLRDEVQVTVIATGLDKATSADAGASSAAGEEAAPWRPVWLRRAQAGDQTQPLARTRRKGVTQRGVDAPTASEGTGADSA
jgi:cell division protein FtsZ